MTPAERKAVFQLGTLLRRSFDEVMALPDYELDQWFAMHSKGRGRVRS